MTFDEQQNAVINNVLGNALVLAGAGSGKTATVTERAARLILSGMRPTSLVMMTFTNKAAREMRQRIHAKLKDHGFETNNPPAVTTFHSFGQRIIIKNPEACGRQGIPSLMSEDDQDSLLNTSFKKFSTNDFVCKAGADIYDKIRNQGLSAGHKEDETAILNLLGKLCGSMDHPVDWEPIWLGAQDYEREKEKLNTLDYHDLLILPIHALQNDTHLRLKFQAHIQDLTIDEAQDTNIAQYRLVQLLAPANGNQTVIMIGDEDQSIHRWRGANPGNLKMFNDEYRPTHFRLERNYRSLPDIVTRADRVIKNNTDRFEKNGIPVRKSSINPISYQINHNDDEMSLAIAQKIREALDRGVEPSDIAILYRTNRMANLLEPALLAQDIPYQIYNGQDLLSRVESKIILSAIRFAVNPYDLMAFERLTELMPGVGKKFMEKLKGDIKNGETIYHAATRLPEPSQAIVVPMLKSIVELRNSGPTKILTWINEQPEIRNWLTKKAHAQLKTAKVNKPKEFDDWKKFNRKEYLTDDEKESLRADRVMDRCEKYQQRLNETISTYVERMKLVCKTINERCRGLPLNSSIEDQWFEANNVIASPPDEENAKKPGVHLMTIHSAKGLEWEHVHLAGASDGIMPFTRSDVDRYDPEHMQDERRLAYVAITRARDQLCIYHCQRINLMDGKGFRMLNPSPFIQEAGIGLSKQIEKKSFGDRRTHAVMQPTY
jgi:DNA helicase-2/ATP-dependent DNA helicase PcrA